MFWGGGGGLEVGAVGRGGWGDDIFFLGPRRHEKHERFPQQLHEVINIFFSHRKKYILFSAIGPPPPGFNIGTAAVRGASVILVTL